MIQRLGEIAIKKGFISQDQLREAMVIQRSGDIKFGVSPNDKLGKVLLAKSYIKPMDLVRTLYEQKANIDFLYIGSYVVEPRVVTWVTKDLSLKYGILPLVSMNDDVLMIASNKNLSKVRTRHLESAMKRKVELVKVEDDDFQAAINLCYDTFKKRGTNSVRTGEMLVRDNYITQEELDEALKISVKSQRRLGKVLIEMGKVNELDLFKFLSRQQKLALVSATEILLVMDRDLAKGISKAFCLRSLIVPYLKDGDKVFGYAKP